MKLGERNFDEFFFGFMIFRAETFEKKIGQSDMSSWFIQINHEIPVIQGSLQLNYFLRWFGTKLGLKCAKFRYRRHFNYWQKANHVFKADGFVRKSFNRRLRHEIQNLDKWYFAPKTWYFFRAVAEKIISKILFIGFLCHLHYKYVKSDYLDLN